MPRIPTASVVVVNYNGVDHLSAMLTHLQLQTNTDFELTVVDNGSTDTSLAHLQEVENTLPFPVHVIRNPTNLGFGPATNQGMRRSVAPWIATLNNDTRPEPDWLEQMLAAAGSDSNVGMIGAKMLRSQFPTQIDSAGISVDWTGIAWDRHGGDRDDILESEIEEVFGPCAGAALYSRALFNDVGLFDNDFFAYLEDVDLAWRARLAGWRALYQPRARVLHAHSATLGDASPRKRFLLARNKLWLLAKNYPMPDLAKFLPMIGLYDVLATAYGTGSWRDSASIRGRLAGTRKLPYFLKKRRTIFERWNDVENWRRSVSPIDTPWGVTKRYAHLQQTRAQRQTLPKT